ncbi:hypothetical protein BL253_12760 [Pseudofrankia asymbiotica]|uniref:PPM-type phosphatase domain-containing protein n=1 Tax=Pseudofrankia asymbiotica TaxID=1834516 RepID=A0A1V2IC61_9ACTN|nr:hypothetical protein BL253_12760 [Pseudofrankia asymbiotica]
MTDVAAGPPRAASTVRSVLLLGPDHPTRRETVIAGISACVDGAGDHRGDPAALGAALSAGWLPKAVPSVEPNEDGVMLAAGPGGLLLAVADGHGGSAAATAALRALAVAAADLLAPPAEGTDRRGGARLVRALAAAAVDGVADVAEPARTALGLVLAVDESIFSTGYGDTLTALVRRGRPRVISTPSEFLGPGTRGSQDEGRSVERRRRRPGDAVLIVSDGVPDYLGRAFPEAVGTVLRGDGRSVPDAPAVARALVGRAGAAGAGDNITAAVLLPAAPPSWRARLRR